jgi:hypothetical protein
MSQSKRHLRQYGLLLLFLLLAFGLRLYQLDGQSFWSDEGLSLYRAQQATSDVWRNLITIDDIDTRDTNPPFYFLLLHLWRQATGDSMLTLRYLGVLLALPSVPLIYLMGKQIASVRVGLLAGLLLAISPFHVWQSQVLRNYGLLITLNLFCVYALWRLINNWQSKSRYWPWLLLWLGSVLAGIYTHYFGFFILAYTLLALAWTGWQHWGGWHLLRRRGVWLVFLASFVLLLPVIPIALERFAAGQQIDFHWVPIHVVAYHAASAYAVGMSWSLTQAGWRVWPVLLMAGWGLVWLWRQRPLNGQLVVGYQLIPLGILLGLSLVNPLYNGTRHLLLGLPPFLLLLAAGVGQGRTLAQRGLMGLGLLLVVGSQTAHLIDQFHASELVRDDVRGVALYLNQVATAADLVVLHDTILQFTFDYYYEGDAPVVTAPTLAEFNPAQVQARLEDLAAEASRVWFLTEPMPRTGFDRTFLSDWVNDNWALVTEYRYPALWLPMKLAVYLPQPETAALPSRATAVSARWESGVQLQGYDAPTQVRPGYDWWVSFYLLLPATEVIINDHLLSLALHDEQGRMWATLEHGFDAAKTAVYNPDLIQRYDFPLQLPVGLPPGNYQLNLRLVNWQTGQTIPLNDGATSIDLGEVTILPSLCQQPIRGHPQVVDQNLRLHPDLSWRGYTALTDIYRPGHALDLTLFWCAERSPSSAFRLRLTLVDRTGQVIATSEQPLAGGVGDQWQAGQLLLDEINLTVPGTAQAESHTLYLSLLTDNGETAVPIPYRWLGRADIPIADITIVPWPFVTEFPPVATPFAADWGEPPLLSLHGYDLAPVQPGEMLPLTLYWRGQNQTIADNYSVFIHIVAEGEEIIAQADGPPLHGFRPTSSWRAGEALVDEWMIWLPPDLSPGTYDIYLGLYLPDSGERLPVFQDGEMQPDGRLWLDHLAVGGVE